MAFRFRSLIVAAAMAGGWCASAPVAADASPHVALHVRFPTPLRWSGTFAGEVSSSGPATCHVNAALRVGRVGNRAAALLVKRRVEVGRCDTTWRPLRIRFTKTQRARILSAARAQHRRPVLDAQVVGTAVGASRPDLHARNFIVTLPGTPKPTSSPGTTRIAYGASLVTGAPEAIRGNLFIREPAGWRRTTPDGGLHAEFSLTTSGCAARAVVGTRAMATRLTASQRVAQPLAGYPDTVASGGNELFAWRVVAGDTNDRFADLIGLGLRRIAPRRVAGVEVGVGLADGCPPSAAREPRLVAAVEGLVRSVRLRVRLRRS